MIHRIFKNLTFIALCLGIIPDIFSDPMIDPKVKYQLNSLQGLPFELQVHIFRTLIDDAQTQEQLQEYINKYSVLSTYFKDLANTKDGQKIIKEKYNELFLRRAQEKLNELYKATKHNKKYHINLSQGINAENIYHDTILHIAAEGHFSPAFIKQIIKAGAKINQRGFNGTTPLHRAAMTTSLEVMKVLIANGADVNARDIQDQTPLDKIILKYQHDISHQNVVAHALYYDLIALLLKSDACVSAVAWNIMQSIKNQIPLQTNYLINNYYNPDQPCTKRARYN